MDRVREERSPTGGGTSDCDLWFWRKSDRGHVDIPITGIEKKDCHSSFSVVIFLPNITSKACRIPVRGRIANEDFEPGV